MSRKYHKVTLFLPIAYFVIVSIFLIRHGTWLSPDLFFLVALFITLILGRTKQFIHDWSIPILLLLSYDYLRGLAPKLTQAANIYPMINFDKALFGSLPTNSLQSALFSDGLVHWYDYLGTALYMSHFIAPMIIGFIFWLKDKEYFRRFFLALLLLSYAAFFTYVIFPATPPWMAAQQGLIPPVHKVMDQVFVNLPHSINLPSVYKFIGVNLVAAVPSLHAAYPFLILLFLVRKYKAKGLLFLPYMLGVWFSIVYFGEHYVFDIVVGVIYAVVIFSLVINAEKLWQRLMMPFYKINFRYNEKIWNLIRRRI
ncbi:phosphatase PAP2 family protein [Patescibacteria group bacterium]|nr:phosphatase PAP2 family protein [Patescibacteria group bacterium]MCL5784996.1 phosphatase PAP2 family protein [Patescibacteria group bacterium]